MTKKRARDSNPFDTDSQPLKYCKIEDMTRIEHIKNIMQDKPEIATNDIPNMYTNQIAFKSETDIPLPNLLSDQINFIKMDNNEENYIQLYNQAVDDFTSALVLVTLSHKNEFVHCCVLTIQCVENCIKSYQLFHSHCGNSLGMTLNLGEYYKILESGPLVYPRPFLLQAFNILKQLQQLFFS